MPKGIYERTEEHKRNLGAVHKGMKRSEQTKRKISEAKKGQIPWNKGIPHSEKTKRKMRGIKRGKNYGVVAEKHPNWKGGSRVTWQRKSRKVWKEYHGRKIPKGHLIHHKDENFRNIDPENLKLMKQSGHKKRHFQLKKLKEMK